MPGTHCEPTLTTPDGFAENDRGLISTACEQQKQSSDCAGARTGVVLPGWTVGILLTSAESNTSLDSAAHKAGRQRSAAVQLRSMTTTILTVVLRSRRISHSLARCSDSGPAVPHAPFANGRTRDRFPLTIASSLGAHQISAVFFSGS